MTCLNINCSARLHPFDCELNEKAQKLFTLYNNNKVPNWKSSEDKSKTNEKTNKKDKSDKTNDSQKAKETHQPKLKPEGGVNSTSGKYDCCAYIIHCPKHDKILVTKQDEIIWLPFTPLSPNRSWKDGALVGFYLVLSGSEQEKFIALKDSPPYEQFRCMQVLRLQMPQTLKFITRLIYYFKLNPESKFKCCEKVSNQLDWLPLADIKKGTVKKLWGPELVDYCCLISEQFKQKISEYSLEEAFLYVPRDPPRNLEEDMLKSLHITEKDVEKLYADFLEHCFPSFYQTIESFKCYIAKYGFEKNDSRLTKLFRAFNYNSNGYLSFHEFLLGLACMEPNILHGEFRVRFIFRYYDSDTNGHLNEDEMKLMLTDMFPDEKNVEQKLKEANPAIGQTQINGRGEVSIKDFTAAIGSHKFRGTSTLCRSSIPIFNQISRSIAAKNLNKTGSKQILQNVLIKRKYNGICTTCKEKKYEVACHLARFDANGKLESKRLPQIGEQQNKGLTAQQYSIDIVFNMKSAANLTIQLIRNFNNFKGTSRQPQGLMQDRKEHLWSLLLAIYNDIDILLEAEEKCQKVYSPCYVMGDIHGNLEDLLSLEKVIWKQIPCVGSNYLFLGDYVDRGQWGFECSLYLMAFKILCPNKVTLLRGNHEVRLLQTHYTYKRECINKYGEVFGLKVWELTNRIFDKYPVCALVDDAVYCAHGGIPRSAQETDQICKVKRELRDPERESNIAWEILWSDPCHMQQFLEIADILNLNPNLLNGYIKNTKRGTAFLFNEVGANNFLRNNGLTHIIRAHEVPPLGYTFHFGSKCVTIFSCSHYCGNDNDCGLILADNQRLRVIHLDTVNNASATD